MQRVVSTAFLLIWFVRLSAAQIGPVSFSPDGKFIAFTYAKSDSCFIYKAEVKNGNAKRLTLSKDGCKSDPAFSRDGRLIAYSYTPPGGQHSNLYIVNSDGSNSHQLLQADTDDVYPVFAPDGKTLYFMRSRFFGHYSPIVRPRRHDFDLFRVDVNTKKVQAITDSHFYEVSAPSLHPGGKNIIFVRPGQAAGASTITFYTVGYGEDGLRFSPHVKGEPEGGPILSDASYLPGRGLTIIFQAASEGSPYFNYDVYRVTLPRGKLEDLTPGIGYASGVRPSPDGKTAIFLKWNVQENTNQLYVLDLATRKITLLNLSGLD